MVTVEGVEIKLIKKVDTLQQFEKEFPREGFSQVESNILRSLEGLYEDENIFIGAWHRRTLIGLISVGERRDLFTKEMLTFIDVILVHPFYRNQQIGYQLLMESLKFANTIKAAAFLVSDEAKSLFTKVGFKPTNCVMYQMILHPYDSEARKRE